MESRIRRSYPGVGLRRVVGLGKASEESTPPAGDLGATELGQAGDELVPGQDRQAGGLLDDGHQGAFAVDGQDGLEKALTLRPDVILSDMMMPRMSGDHFVRAVRAQPDLDGVPIIILTARSDEELPARLLSDTWAPSVVISSPTSAACVRASSAC